MTTTAGGLFQLIRTRRATTRSEFGTVTGLSRTAVTARLDALISAGLIRAGAVVTGTGGRPSESWEVAEGAGVVLAVAVGRSRHQVGVYDLVGKPLATADAEHVIGLDAPTLMPQIVTLAAKVLSGIAPPLLAVGLSLPGAVDDAALCSIGSPVIPGWDGVTLRPYFAELADPDQVAFFMGNDADVLAHAELLGRPELREALVLKASTGLGLGIVTEGRLVHGHLGAAGELGHCRVATAADRVCRCGRTGCLETIAGGWALTAGRDDCEHVRDLVVLARRGDVDARARIRQAGVEIGAALGFAVNLLNPDAIVVGGDLSGLFDVFSAGLRESIYATSTELATRELRVLPSVYGDQAGLVGCAALALDRALRVEAIDSLVRGPA